MSKYVAEKLDRMKKNMGVHMGKRKMERVTLKKKLSTSDGYMKK